MEIEPLAQSVLDFWFGPLSEDGTPSDSEKSARWFRKDADFDREIEKKFAEYMEAASWGGFDLWSRSPEGITALIVLMDQFPRNLYRNQARSFYFDARALSFAQQVVAQKWHLSLPTAYAYFCLMPFMHSESLSMQEAGIEAFKELNQASHSHSMVRAALDYAIAHRDIIARFGRFPHRNEILGRESTAEEIEFLKKPGSRF